MLKSDALSDGQSTPEKLLSIGEAAKLIGVEIHTVRFWTEEFSSYISLTLGKGGRRYYNSEAVETLKKINELIHVEGIRIKSIKEKRLLYGSQTEINFLAELHQAANLLCEAKKLIAS